MGAGFIGQIRRPVHPLRNAAPVPSDRSHLPAEAMLSPTAWITVRTILKLHADAKALSSELSIGRSRTLESTVGGRFAYDVD
jgi:hypothetical protein